MDTKTAQIIRALEAGDDRKAVSLASRFFDRSEATLLYKQAQGAANNPRFYRQIGKDPDAIIGAAVSNLRARFLPA